MYYPQLGYLISVPFKESMLDQEQCQAVGWEFQVRATVLALGTQRRCVADLLPSLTVPYRMGVLQERQMP